MKNKRLYITGLLCGLIPLIVGLLIFFCWYLARALFAFDLHSLEDIGFFWILISIPVAIAGIVIMIIYFLKDFRHNLLKTLFGLFIILINIPTVIWVSKKQGELNQKAYIKFYNQTQQDDLELNLKSSGLNKYEGTFSSGQSMVAFFYPKYLLNSGGTSYPDIDSVYIELKNKNITRTVLLPRIDMGQCKKLYIDKGFQLHQ